MPGNYHIICASIDPLSPTVSMPIVSPSHLYLICSNAVWKGYNTWMMSARAPRTVTWDLIGLSEEIFSFLKFGDRSKWCIKLEWLYFWCGRHCVSALTVYCVYVYFARYLYHNCTFVTYLSTLRLLTSCWLHSRLWLWIYPPSTSKFVAPKQDWLSDKHSTCVQINFFSCGIPISLC